MEGYCHTKMIISTAKHMTFGKGYPTLRIYFVLACQFIIMGRRLTILSPCKSVSSGKALFLAPAILVLRRALTLAEQASTTVPVAAKVHILRRSIRKQRPNLLSDNIGCDCNIVYPKCYITNDMLAVFITRPSGRKG